MEERQLPTPRTTAFLSVLLLNVAGLSLENHFGIAYAYLYKISGCNKSVINDLKVGKRKSISQWGSLDLSHAPPYGTFYQ